MTLFAVAMAFAMSMSFTTVAGPVPDDRSTNKPSAEACAAASRAGRTLPGCGQQAEAEVNEAGGDVNRPSGQGQQGRFLVCPQDPRCPR